VKAALTAVLTGAGVTGRRLQLSRLVVIEWPDRGKELAIQSERVTVGRGLICSLVLTDTAISATHFEIEAQESGFLLRDLDSTNGTLCGDVKVREAWLAHGQIVRAGQTALRVARRHGGSRRLGARLVPRAARTEPAHARDLCAARARGAD
jgi:pSer/pThr/pTyr-binding forkhead associated (FHA) protein